MFDLRTEFPSEWHRFLHPAIPASGNEFEFEMSPQLFRALDRGKTLTVNSITVLVRGAADVSYDCVFSFPPEAVPPAGENELRLARVNKYGGLHFAKKTTVGWSLDIDPALPPAKWKFVMKRSDGASLQLDPVTGSVEVSQVLLILGYEWP